MAVYFLIGTYGYLNTTTSVKALLHKVEEKFQCDCCAFHGFCLGELTTQVEEEAWEIIEDDIIQEHGLIKRSACRWQSISIMVDYE